MRYGFSLVELSIVLVVLGLLVGGVITGQSLIRAAELRSIPAEFAIYQGAVHTFRERYLSLPGDMNNATRFWGQMGAGGTGGPCPATTGTGTETCNGNGNGLIDHLTSGHEFFLFWQHLANAGLIEGQFTGVSGPLSPPNPGGRDVIVGINSPRSKYGSDTTWMPVARCTGSSLCWDVAGVFGINTLYFGAHERPDSVEMAKFALKPIDAWNIDVKMDDGKPGAGKLWSRGINMCAYVPPNILVNSANKHLAEYDIKNVIWSSNPLDARHPDACNLAFINVY